jgi:hypothetical protein
MLINVTWFPRYGDPRWGEGAIASAGARVQSQALGRGCNRKRWGEVS